MSKNRKLEEDIGHLAELKEPTKLTAAVIGSHSALDVCDGAFQQGIPNLVIAQKGRDKTYSKYFFKRQGINGYNKGFINEILYVDKFSDVLNRSNLEILTQKNSIIIPNRSMTSYINVKTVENELLVPFFGSRDMLYIEEREMKNNYYWLLEEGEIPTPEKVENPEKIRGITIVKLPHAVKKLERGFFTCSSYGEYIEKSNKLINSGTITKEDLADARMEKYIIGPVFNFDFFWSPLDRELELLGIDWRFETSLDGHVRLPAEQQLTLPDSERIPEYTVVGHASSTLRESSLDRIFDIGEKFVSISRKHFEKGIIGPFTIQTCIDKDLNPYVYDVSPRIGGGTNIHLYVGHPYGNSMWRMEMSTGNRVALEIRRAVETGSLKEVLT